MTHPESTQRALLPVLGVQFIGALGLSLVLPFLIFVVRDLGGNALAYGVLSAMYPAAQMIGAPWLGRWSDRIGRRPVLAITQAGTMLSWLLFLGAMMMPRVELLASPLGLLTLPLVGLFLARIADGLTGGNVAVANAVVADISSAAVRSRNFGRMGAAGNLGFIAGPMLAGLLGATAWGARLPVMAAATVALIGLVVVLTRLPETKPIRADDDPGGPSLGLFEALELPGAALLLPLYFVIFLGFNVFYSAFPAHAAGLLEWTPQRMGIFFAVLSGLMVLVQGPLLSRIAPHVPPSVLISGGNVLLAGAFACITTGEELLTWVCAVLFALGNGLMWPSYLTVLSSVGGPEHRGAIQGHAASMGSAASIAGLVFGGALYEWLGAATFFVPSVVLVVAGLLSGRICRTQVEARPAT